MRRVYKYEMKPRHSDEYLAFAMPEGAKFLHFMLQGEVMCAWFEVDTERHPCKRIFKIFGTGWDLPPSGWQYLGTLLSEGGNFVWHLYEERPEAHAATDGDEK